MNWILGFGLVFLHLVEEWDGHAGLYVFSPNLFVFRGMRLVFTSYFENVGQNVGRKASEQLS